MAAISNQTIDELLAQVPDAQLRAETRHQTSATILLDVLARVFHSKTSEWLFLRELRVGTGPKAVSINASMPLP
jgi:hypothetical protein